MVRRAGSTDDVAVSILDTGPPSVETPGDYHDRPRSDLVAIAERHGVGGRTLDVGCAAGRLGQDLLASGMASEVVGIEVDARVAERAAGRLSQVICADMSDPTVRAQLPHPFDAMIFADVLEHLPDPLDVLRDLARRLPAHGLCLISLPNVRHFRVLGDLVLRNEWEYKDQGVCDATHLRFFTARSAVRLCREAGLRVLGLHLPLHHRSARVARLLPPSKTFLSDHIVIVASLDAQ